MIGTDSATGKHLSGLDHVRQSITDILTTPLGSRVFRRDYGSNLFSLIDAPLNAATLVQMYAATAEALAKWEPRILVQKVGAERLDSGAIEIKLEALYLPDGQIIKLEGIVVE